MSESTKARYEAKDDGRVVWVDLGGREHLILRVEEGRSADWVAEAMNQRIYRDVRRALHSHPADATIRDN